MTIREITDEQLVKRAVMNAIHAEMCGVDPTWIRQTFERMECFE